MSLRVLVCGSRHWTNPHLVHAVLTGLYAETTVGHLSAEMSRFTVIHGDCPTGADAAARWWAEDSPMHSHNERPDHVVFEHLRFPADWKTHGRAAGPIRNNQMLDEGAPDVVYAFKDNFDWTAKGGTEDMARQAMRAGVPVYVVGQLG